MNREQMIEKARLWLESNLTWDTFEGQDDSWFARGVVDAILPQVTTVEELEALAPGAVVVDRDGEVWQRVPHEGWRRGLTGNVLSSQSVAMYPPLTVVWSPS